MEEKWRYFFVEFGGCLLEWSRICYTWPAWIVVSSAGGQLKLCRVVRPAWVISKVGFSDLF